MGFCLYLRSADTISILAALSFHLPSSCAGCIFANSFIAQYAKKSFPGTHLYICLMARIARWRVIPTPARPNQQLLSICLRSPCLLTSVTWGSHGYSASLIPLYSHTYCFPTRHQRKVSQRPDEPCLTCQRWPCSSLRSDVGSGGVGTRVRRRAAMASLPVTAKLGWAFTI